MSKYPRTYHLLYSPGTTSDDRFAKDISNIIGKRIIITEKLDGENTGMERGGVYSRSHATYAVKPWNVGIRELHSVINRMLDEDIMLFGENMEGIHSIKYNDLKSYFYLFGVRDNNVFLNWDDVKFYSDLLELELVPVLFDGVVSSEEELKDLVEDLVIRESMLDGEDINSSVKLMEGIVIRPFNSFKEEDFSKNVFKWVRANHVQTDIHWTKNWKRAKINWG